MRRTSSVSALNADYWIVNLNSRELEVYRQPTPDAKAVYGFAYQDRRVLEAKDRIAPLARPKARVRVADLLP
jgi:Uma2 family endonuclease